MKSPCKDCQRRKLLCHGQCADYKQFREQIEEKHRQQQVIRDSGKALPRAYETLYRRSLKWK